ncbi:nuclear transport factor 2 family protein [Flavobacterium franklandianum]|uniref:Nuclear transport factor 2 family protein n=1 Tax=Flavobacterium franklandianum TaxID=2594430 RepID=A0A553C726_9FLAO|nr:nuclear transport factor 2 family protein [Flavobacterium franklandianum]TRX16308.1 nuclear transport factor 2 family protein [Flavobacterium franklandianum]TRX24278.1 nuclear transport factor 2 family protein [Flavobacterium franklandianum]
MTPNETTINKFYTAFSDGDAEQMCEYYHPNVQFSDPAFGQLKGEEVRQMWKMLIERTKGNLKIDLSQVKANEHLGSAFWIVKYNFSKTNRKIENSISAKFLFKDGLIIKHTDDFDIWKWSKQALGIKGFLLGWTGFMQNKIQNQARMNLKNYSQKKIQI